MNHHNLSRQLKSTENSLTSFHIQALSRKSKKERSTQKEDAGSTSTRRSKKRGDKVILAASSSSNTNNYSRGGGGGSVALSIRSRKGKTSSSSRKEKNKVAAVSSRVASQKHSDAGSIRSRATYQSRGERSRKKKPETSNPMSAKEEVKQILSQGDDQYSQSSPIRDDSWSLGSLSFMSGRKGNRKEDGGDAGSVRSKSKASRKTRFANEKDSNEKKTNSPTTEFDERSNKWIIANHNHDMSNNNKIVLTIYVYDSKQHVYIHNCHGVNIQIQGKKANAILMEDCSNTNVVFGTVIGAYEVVRCQDVALQTKGMCPTFSLDMTDKVTVWLSEETRKISSFVTSKCTQVNISIPIDGDESNRKEIPLPEQFVHRLDAAGDDMQSFASKSWT